VGGCIPCHHSRKHARLLFLSLYFLKQKSKLFDKNKRRVTRNLADNVQGKHGGPAVLIPAICVGRRCRLRLAKWTEHKHGLRLETTKS
jgi:hypothetical protein